MKKIYALILCTGCFTIAFAQTPSGKLVLNKGQKLQVNNVVKSVITQEMMGQSMEIQVDVTTARQLEVKEKLDNQFLLASTLTKITTSGNVMGQEMTFDSDKKEDLDSETGKAMKSELNVPREVTLDEKATVIKTKTAETKEKKESSTPGVMDMMKSFTGGENDDSHGSKEAFAILPEGKKVGDSWADSTITEEIKTFRTYTLKDINGTEATVSVEGKQVTNKKVEQMGMEINVTMEGKLSGESVVDISNGIVKQSSLTMDATGNADMMGQSVPLTTKTTTTTTVKSL